MDSPSADPLDTDLGWMLGVVFREYLRASEAAVAELPGGARGYQLLAAAARGQARNQGALGARLGIDRTVLTYLLDDLEGAGLVARRRDPADRRSRLIDATDAGRSALAGYETAVRRVEDHVLGALPADDAVAFRRLLRTLACGTADHVTTGEMCQVVEQATAPDRAATPRAARDRAGAPRTRPSP